MKNLGFIFGIIFFGILTSCKSEDAKILDVVNKFLTERNSEEYSSQGYDDLITEDYANLVMGKYFYTIKNWKLEIRPMDFDLVSENSMLMVEATGETHNNRGTPKKVVQRFALTDKFGKWQIDDSYGFVSERLNFDIADTQWDFYWDRKKEEVLKELQSKLKLSVLVKGYRTTYSDYARGKLKLENNSDYDIKGVTILIEHFDKDGLSVNTDKKTVWDIIRKHGYREFDWITGDCAKCVKQEFKISFTKED